MAKHFLRPCGLQGQERSISDFKFLIVAASPLCLLCEKFPAHGAKTLKTTSGLPNPLTPNRSSVKLHSRIRVDPRLGEMDDEPFGVIAAFKPIGQAGDAVRVPLPGALPSDFRAATPLLVALIERGEGDDQTLIVIEIRHGWQSIFHGRASLTTIEGVSFGPSHTACGRD
jgi:hypothetical protein